MLVIGYGNPGRCDDGLGPAFAARLAGRNLPGIKICTDYQLTVDHALMISGVDRVVFVDALMQADEPFRFGVAQPSASHDLASHSLDPSAVLALALTLFGADPEAHILGISGVEFGEVREELSDLAAGNLDVAESFFLNWLEGLKVVTDARGHAHA